MSDINKRKAGIAAILGCWLMAFPVVVPDVIALSESFALFNYLIVGGVIAVTSGYTWWAAEEGGLLVAGCSLVSAVLAGWLLLLPFYTSAVDAGWVPWNDVAVGVVVLAIGLGNAMGAVDLGFDLSPSTSR